MEQFHLNDLLERTTRVFLKIRKEDTGFLARCFGTYAKKDYDFAKKYLDALAEVAPLPEKSLKLGIRIYGQKIVEGINYIHSEFIHQPSVTLEGVSAQQYAKAFAHVSSQFEDFDPKPVRPAA